MGTSGNDYNRGNEPIRRYKRKSGSAALRNGVTAAMAVLIIIGVVVYIMSVTGTGLFRDPTAVPDAPSDSGSTEASDSQSEQNTAESTSDTTDVTTEDPSTVQYKYLDKDASDIGSGDLVLIDADHIYKFPSSSLDTLYGNMNASYKVSNASLSLRISVINALNKMMEEYAAATGFKDAIVTSAYRDFDTQQTLHDNNPSGAALPGCSDYHSGATLMLQGYIDDNSGIFNLSNRSEANAAWFKEHMSEYGFIFRFPSDKKTITGYNIPWQIRYVGTPHATYMAAHNLCLEEYLNLLAEKYTYTGEHLTVDCADGMRYEIFYVAGADEGIIKLPVPSNRDYTVSGDNKSGFIVTVEVGEVTSEQEA